MKTALLVGKEPDRSLEFQYTREGDFDAVVIGSLGFGELLYFQQEQVLGALAAGKPVYLYTPGLPEATGNRALAASLSAGHPALPLHLRLMLTASLVEPCAGPGLDLTHNVVADTVGGCSPRAVRVHDDSIVGDDGGIDGLRVADECGLAIVAPLHLRGLPEFGGGAVLLGTDLPPLGGRGVEAGDIGSGYVVTALGEPVVT